MAGCYRKDSICITFDCPLRHYQAWKWITISKQIFIACADYAPKYMYHIMACQTLHYSIFLYFYRILLHYYCIFWDLYLISGHFYSIYFVSILYSMICIQYIRLFLLYNFRLYCIFSHLHCLFLDLYLISAHFYSILRHYYCIFLDLYFVFNLCSFLFYIFHLYSIFSCFYYIIAYLHSIIFICIQSLFITIL